MAVRCMGWLHLHGGWSRVQRHSLACDAPHPLLPAKRSFWRSGAEWSPALFMAIESGSDNGSDGEDTGIPARVRDDECPVSHRPQPLQLHASSGTNTRALEQEPVGDQSQTPHALHDEYCLVRCLLLKQSYRTAPFVPQGWRAWPPGTGSPPRGPCPFHLELRALLTHNVHHCIVPALPSAIQKNLNKAAHASAAVPSGHSACDIHLPYTCCTAAHRCPIALPRRLYRSTVVCAATIAPSNSMSSDDSDR